MHTVESLGYDREKMFPLFHAAIESGKPLLTSAGAHEAAQDRVAMRRFIRANAPCYIHGALKRELREMGAHELNKLCESIISERGALPSERTGVYK